MDIFVEYLVKKKKKASDYLKMAGISIGGTVLLFVVFLALTAYIPQISSIALLLVVGGYYGIYLLITSFNIEYEYSMVNNEIDIDKIINVRRRKRLTTINIRTVECFGRKSDGGEFESRMRNTHTEKLYACRDKDDDSVYYAVYRENDADKMILFNPSDKMLEKMHKLNPHKINRYTAESVSES